MLKLRPTSDGSYTFDDVVALKEFLSIDDRCLAKGQKDRCKKTLKKREAEISAELKLAIDAGFPSTKAADMLLSVAQKCICGKKHLHIVSGYGDRTELVLQHDDIYHEWTRRLWVAFLQENGVYWVYGNKSPPRLADGVEWKEELRHLKALSTSKSPLRTVELDKYLTKAGNVPDRPARSATSQGIPEPSQQRRRTFTAGSTRISNLSTRLRKLYPFSRSPTSSSLSLGKRDETQQVLNVEEVESPGRNCEESLQHNELRADDDSRPSTAAIQTQIQDRIETPEKRYDSNGDVGSGVLEPYTKGDASPNQSIQSVAPSLAFSLVSNFETPNTTYSRDSEIGTIEKRPSTREEGKASCNDPVDTILPPSQHDQKVQPLASSDSSKVDSSFDDTTHGASDKSFIGRLKNNPTEFNLKFSSAKRPPHATGDHPETPTKIRTVARHAAPSPDGDERLHASRDDSNFVPYHKGKDVKQYDALKHLLDLLEKPVHPPNRDAGYIYMFRRDTEPEFLKIGYSKMAFDERMTNIATRCGYKGEFLENRYIDVAVSVIERCVHYHLDEYRHCDQRCVKILEKAKKSGAAEGKKLCDQRHKEWFRAPRDRVSEVFTFWEDFVKTDPFVNGRLSSFWRNEIVTIWDKVALWEKAGNPAFDCWDEEMRGAFKRWEKFLKGNPRAELPLRLVVRREGTESVFEVFDERGSSGMPLLTIPLLSKPESV